jgi:hypothetical protein
MATQFWPNPLSDAFFSEFNRATIQKSIISKMREKTGYTIDEQNDGDLQALMKRVYINMLANPYVNVRQQVEKMNDKVVEEASGTISTGMLQQLLYLRDISSNPVPLAPPISTSTYGNKIPNNFKIGF